MLEVRLCLADVGGGQVCVVVGQQPARHSSEANLFVVLQNISLAQSVVNR